MDIIKNKWFKFVFYGVLGMTAGFAYYYFIGCNSGSCPITGNPYISSIYGLGAGLVLGWPGKKQSR
ncbi:MAG: DUF6132 family protein [Calditrichaceae bacterium]|jgi:hypothetical protein